MNDIKRESLELMVNHRPQENGDTEKMTSSFKGRQFKPGLFNSIVMGAIIGMTVNEVCIQLLLKMSVDAGELPAYINDVFFVTISLLEALLAPFISWLGYNRRKLTLIVWIALAVVCALPLFFLGFDSVDENDLCTQSAVTTRLTTTGTAKSIIRVIVLVLMGLSSALARVSFFTHGSAVLEEQCPETFVKNFGILITARVIALLMAKSVAVDFLVHHYWLQVLIMVAPLIVKTVILAIMSSVLSVEGESQRDFVSTIQRVYKNWTVIIHSIVAGLLCAGIWGFSLYNTQVVAAKYRYVFGQNSATMNADMLRWQYVIVTLVLIFSYKYTPSVLKEISRRNPIKQMLLMSVISIILIIISAVLKCEQSIKGLNAQYLQPECSLGCGCTPRQLNEFNPVCMLDTMTTYYSPCHAGCNNYTQVNGVTVLKNCRCSISGGDAVVGACAPLDCLGVYTLHQTLYTAVIALAVTSFLLHGLVILKAVHPGDKSTALGAALSIITLIAFVGGHVMFMGLSSWTCAYMQNDRCYLQSPNSGLVIGIASASLVTLSAVVNTVNFVIMKRKS